MSILEVPGARLYYETYGSGPLVVTIPGSPGIADVYMKLAEQLSSRYTVLAYDRRGFSRSQLTEPQDYGRRIETDADDVRRLIEHVWTGPAIVLGGSSGGLIALVLLATHPSVVRAIVPYEPPAVTELSEKQAGEWIAFFDHIYELQQTVGMELALKQFRERAFAESDQEAFARIPRNEAALANAKYWFEHELRQYPRTRRDLDALKKHAGQVILAAGRESRGHLCYQVNEALSAKLGRDLVELPGGHLGYLARAPGFARELEPHLDRVAGSALPGAL